MLDKEKYFFFFNLMIKWAFIFLGVVGQRELRRLPSYMSGLEIRLGRFLLKLYAKSFFSFFFVRVTQ